LPDGNCAPVGEVLRHLESKNLRLVTKADLEYLARAEEREAKARGVQFFKFSDDEAMLAAIEEQKAQAAAV